MANVIILIVTFFIVMLNAIILNVVMLGVVASSAQILGDKCLIFLKKKLSNKIQF